MPDALTVIHHAERPSVTLPGGAAYQPIVGDDTGDGVPIRTGIQTSQPGYTTPLHSHPYAEVLTVIEGRGEAWLDGEEGIVVLEPGITIVVPAKCARFPGRWRPAARHLWHPHPRQADRRLRIAATDYPLSAFLPRAAASHSSRSFSSRRQHDGHQPL